MSEIDDRYAASPPGRRAAEPSLGELFDGVARKLVTGLVIAGAAIGLAIYARPGPPRYEAIAAPDGRIIRIDTRSGTVIACEGRTCTTVLRPGQRLHRELPARALPPPAPAAQPRALPAPAEAPAPAPAR